MKKSLRLLLTGAVQGMFFEQFIKENAEKLDVRGFMRKLDDGKVEIFIEADNVNVDSMFEVCKKGSQHSQIRSIEQKPERFQDFRNFKILKI